MLSLSPHPPHPYAALIESGWMTENTAGVGKRTVASGLIIGAANIYALWSSQIYRSDDSPLFRRGNDINIAFCAAAVVLWLLLKWQYVHANRTRAERTLALSEDERREVEARMEVDGSRGLLFRWVVWVCRGGLADLGQVHPLNEVRLGPRTER